MWDPVVAPSFDEDGKSAIAAGLKNVITEILKPLTTSTKRKQNSFETIGPEQYWFELVILEKMVFSEKAGRPG